MDLIEQFLLSKYASIVPFITSLIVFFKELLPQMDISPMQLMVLKSHQERKKNYNAYRIRLLVVHVYLNFSIMLFLHVIELGNYLHIKTVTNSACIIMWLSIISIAALLVFVWLLFKGNVKDKHRRTYVFVALANSIIFVASFQVLSVEVENITIWYNVLIVLFSSVLVTMIWDRILLRQYVNPDVSYGWFEKSGKRWYILDENNDGFLLGIESVIGKNTVVMYATREEVMQKGIHMEDDYRHPLLSVIIPVYNTASTLRRCLDSVCDQTYKNLEIIIIDDGSTDGAQIVVDEYALKDPRIKLTHQENAGESAARNVGLQQVTGDYFTFVDCDDWLDLDMYEKLVQQAVDNDVDIAACSWYKEYDDYTEEITNEGKVVKGVFDQETLLKYVYQRDRYRGFTYMWDKVYRRELMYDRTGNIIEFPTDLAIGGDVVYLARMAFNAKTAIYLDKSYYHYYQRMDSGCHSENLQKRLDWIQAYFIILEYIEKHRITTDATPWIERFLAYHSSNVAELAYEQNDSEVLKQCQDYMIRFQQVYEETNMEYPERINRFRKIIMYKIQ